MLLVGSSDCWWSWWLLAGPFALPGVVADAAVRRVLDEDVLDMVAGGGVRVALLLAPSRLGGAGVGPRSVPLPGPLPGLLGEPVVGLPGPGGLRGLCFFDIKSFSKIFIGPQPGP